MNITLHKLVENCTASATDSCVSRGNEEGSSHGFLFLITYMGNTELTWFYISGVDSRIAEEDPQPNRGIWKGQPIGEQKMKLV